MGSVLAIVSKAVFEKQAGDASIGSTLALDHYASLHKSLATLADGGSLFLVTVRPPDEDLWLVAVLDDPEIDKTGWGAKPNRTSIADVSKLKKQLVFTTGTGITAKPGALGMSLQTPRGLTAEDEALLRAAAGAKPAKSTTKKPKPSAKQPSANGDHLAALQRAVVAKDGAAALTTALAWWREQRAPGLANLIDDISEGISGPAVTTELEFTKLASAVNPLDLGRLLPAARTLPVNFLPKLAELLSAYPDDPRIARAFGTWLSPMITTSISKTPFWTSMFDVAERTQDTRVIRALKKLLVANEHESDWWLRFYRNTRRLQSKLAALEPPRVDDKPLGRLALDKLAKITATGTPASKRVSIVAAPPAPKLTGPLLAQAATHLTANRIAAAIDAIVERWRETRVPALADLVDRASRLLPHFDRPLISHGRVLFDEWTAAFDADPVGCLPQLLLTLAAGDQKTGELQMAQIATLPDDPRISLRLAEIGEGKYMRTKAAPYWKALFETLARHRDVRTFDLVKNTYIYQSHHAERLMEKMVANPRTAFDVWPLALDAADAKLFAVLDKRVAAAVAKTEARERELIRGIVDDRSSAAPREVYADWLMDRGHPRGERIMLAHKRARSEAEDARLAELRAIPYVFGTLQDLFEGSDEDLFRTAKVRYDTNTLGWRAVAANPLVALVETVDFDEGDNPTPADFAAFVAAATSLAEIRSCGRDRIAAVDPDYEKHWKVVGRGNSQHVVRI